MYMYNIYSLVRVRLCDDISERECVSEREVNENVSEGIGIQTCMHACRLRVIVTHCTVL